VLYEKFALVFLVVQANSPFFLLLPNKYLMSDGTTCHRIKRSYVYLICFHRVILVDRIIKIAICTCIHFLISFSTYASDIPKLSDYPSQMVEVIHRAKTIDSSDSFTNEFRTIFTNALKNKITFSGEYAVTNWGCGTAGCTVTALINVRTGKALSYTFTHYYDDNEEMIGEDICESNKNSRLLQTCETTEKDVNGKQMHYVNYYLLNTDTLKLIKKQLAP
jgi:hypothetical protein